MNSDEFRLSTKIFNHAVIIYSIEIDGFKNLQLIDRSSVKTRVLQLFISRTIIAIRRMID